MRNHNLNVFYTAVAVLLLLLQICNGVSRREVKPPQNKQRNLA